MVISTACFGTGVLLADRGRLIQKLFDGDPIAWTLVLLAAAGFGIWSYIKRSRKTGAAADQSENISDNTQS